MADPMTLITAGLQLAKVITEKTAKKTVERAKEPSTQVGIGTLLMMFGVISPEEGATLQEHINNVSESLPILIGSVIAIVGCLKGEGNSKPVNKDNEEIQDNLP